MCSLCSRLRRGALYAHAEAEGFTKIALGHHRDDLVATFFLNLFFHAKLSGMPPKLRSDDGKHVVIRPLAYVREADIADYAAARGFPIIPCNLCGSQENLQRKQVQKMMAQWETRIARPHRNDRARARRRAAVAAERSEAVRFPGARRARRCALARCACVVVGRTAHARTTSNRVRSPHFPGFPPSRG